MGYWELQGRLAPVELTVLRSRMGLILRMLPATQGYSSFARAWLDIPTTRSIATMHISVGPTGTALSVPNI